MLVSGLMAMDEQCQDDAAAVKLTVSTASKHGAPNVA